MDLPTEYVRNNTVGNNGLPDGVQGSPYFTEGFVAGKVFTEQNKSYSAMLRYNGYSDQIEMKEMDKVTSLLKREYITARIGNATYKIEKYKDNDATKQGYFVLLNKGEAQLLLRQQKQFVEGKESSTSYGNKVPPKFVEKKDYYIKLGENEAVPVKLKKKELLKLLGDKKGAQEYVSSEGLKLKTEKEVLQFLNHYNNL